MRDATKLSVYFTGERSLFLIPLYQRKYAWQDKHCIRLFHDLVRVHKEGLKSHFFGSIVSVRADETEDDLLIIDGQQRVTTISLLVLAAIHAVKDGVMSCEMSDDYTKDMFDKYIRAKYRRGDRQIKLRPIEQDCKAYDALVAGDKKEFVPLSQSALTRNYQLFYDLIKTSHLSFEDLIEAIEKLIVIDIRLDSSDNPQLIFESLNSCGKDLEEADKIRNYILMSLRADIQEEYYHKYWSKIERYTVGKDYNDASVLTMFIRDYLTMKRRVIGAIPNMYFDFKEYDRESKLSREELLIDMLRFAEFYEQASKGTTADKDVNKKFRQLANLGTGVCMPYYLALLDYADKQALPWSVVYEVLDTIENYWARRIICAYPANSMNKTFAMLHGDVMRIYEKHAERGLPVGVSYAEVVKYVLLRKQGLATFPTDDSVKTAFPTRQVYRIVPDYRNFLIERLENLDSKEANDTIISRLKEGTISIEHIMPQTLTSEWITALGEDWAEIHEQYIHTFGNLTITGYNTPYGNMPFVEKKEGYVNKKGEKIYGFKDSPFRLTNYVKEVNQWTLDEIKERSYRLLENFLHLWPMITTQYKPLEKEFESVAFTDDDIELTGRFISGFEYRGISYKVNTWKDMLVNVCKLMSDEKPTEMVYLAQKEYWVHAVPAKDRSFVVENCYVHSSNSTKTKCQVLSYLFEHLEIPASVLEFHLYPQSDKVVDETAE